MKPNEQVQSAFSKEDSLALKGIAILMMLWHHCFIAGRFENYTINFWPLAQSQVTNIAYFCKMCVSFLAFISGYGLYLSRKKSKKHGIQNSRWICGRLVRTLSSYWFVLAVAWVVCMILDQRPYHVYGFEHSSLLGLWNMGIEFLGFTNLARQKLLSEDWWYMSAAVVFVILLPLIIRGFENIGCLCTLFVILALPRLSMGYPGPVHFYTFLPIFCLGMIFARYDFFARWDRLWKGKPALLRVLKFLIMLVGMLVLYKVSYHLRTDTWWDVKWNLFPLLFILFSKDYLFSILILKKPLMLLGKHATNIFLVHTFIRLYYLQTPLYSLGHFVLILVALLLSSLAISVVLEWLKKVVNYERLIGKLVSVVEEAQGKREAVRHG